GTLASVLGIFLLAPGLGLAGVSIAVLLGSIVKTAAVTLLARRVHNLQWELANFIVILPATFIGGAVIQRVATDHGAVAALALCAAVVLVLVGLTYAVVLTPDQRGRIREALQRRGLLQVK